MDRKKVIVPILWAVSILCDMSTFNLALSKSNSPFPEGAFIYYIQGVIISLLLALSIYYYLRKNYRVSLWICLSSIGIFVLDFIFPIIVWSIFGFV